MIDRLYQKDKSIEKFNNQLSNELFKGISERNLRFESSQNRFLEVISLNMSGIIFKRMNKL